MTGSPPARPADPESVHGAGTTVRGQAIGQLLAAALLLTACGGSGTAPASRPRPPAPINMSVYINDSRISVTPESTGAGPVVFVVTNQSRQAQSLAVVAAGGATLATTAPINPQGTTHVSLNFAPGDYVIAAASQRANEAQRSVPSPIRPARVHIGRERPSSDSELLQP